MYIIENDALEVARKNVEAAQREMEEAVKNGKDIKAAIGRWQAANQSYITLLMNRYNI